MMVECRRTLGCRSSALCLPLGVSGNRLSHEQTNLTPLRCQVDVLVLYSDLTFTAGEEEQLLSEIVAGFSTANEAMTNSGIDLQFNLVRVDQVSPIRARCTAPTPPLRSQV